MVGDEPWKSEGIMMEGPLGLVGTSDVVLNVMEAGESCDVGFLCKTSLWTRKEETLEVLGAWIRVKKKGSQQ